MNDSCPNHDKGEHSSYCPMSDAERYPPRREGDEGFERSFYSHFLSADTPEYYEKADLVIGEWKTGGYCILKNRRGHIHSGVVVWAEVERYIFAQPTGALFVLLKEKT
jgi:hypothetical protein